jgi:uncharacterized membrane protein YbhN (UPF0104 family)
VDALVRAADALFGYLDTIAWGALALALVCHVAKMAVRARSWRNIIAASYPEAEVRWASVFGGYAAGVGVNAVLPARSGDLLRLYVVKHRVRGATYPTLGATLVVDTLLDFFFVSILLVWAVWNGLLPGLDVIPLMPSIDWFWLLRQPRLALVVFVLAIVLSFVLGVWASKHIAAFGRRVALGFAILRTPRVYLLRVVPWQTLDWCFRLGTIYFFLIAFGVPANLHNALLAQVAQSLATVVPLTPGGIGTEQALLLYVFRGEAPLSVLLSFSVGMKFALTVANVVVGFGAIALMLRTLRWRRLVDTDRAEAERQGKAPTEVVR